MIKLQDITKQYDNGVEALKKIDLSFDKAGLVFVLGKSGSGKSTLLNVIGGLDDYQGGKYYLFGKDVSLIRQREWDNLRNYYFGFVFQDYMLLDDLNVKENIEFVLKIQGKTPDDNQVEEVMKKVDILDLSTRKVRELSGGQKQRVAIARALIKNPKIILADEPTGNLDGANSTAIYELFEKLSKDYLIVLFSHDVEAAHRYGRRTITLVDGEIASDVINQEKTYEIINKEESIKLGKKQLYDFLMNASLDSEITIKVKEEERENTSNLTNNKDEKITYNSNLSWKNTISFSMRGIGNGVSRFILSSIVYVLTFYLLIMSLYFSLFDAKNSIVSYIVENNINDYFFFKSVKYETLIGTFNNGTIKAGKDFHSDLSSVFGEDSIFGRKNNFVTVSGELRSYSATVVYADESLFGNNSSVSFSNSQLQAYPTDYFLKEMGLSSDNAIGQHIIIDRTEYSIAGVVPTDYKEYGLDEKLLTPGEVSKYARYRFNQKYNVIYADKRGITEEAVAKNGLIFETSSVIWSKAYETTPSTWISLGNTDAISTTSIIAGRKPQNNSEIAISVDALQLAGYTATNYDGIFDKTYGVFDIHDQFYNGYYNDILNLRDYMTKEIKIVGIYDETGSIDAVGANIGITGSVFNRIIFDYCNYFYYDDFMVHSNKTNESQVLSSLNMGFECDEPSISVLSDFDNVIGFILPFVFAALAILLLLSAISIVSYMSYQTDINKKTIGILKALGISDKDILKIYLFQVIFIAVLTLIVVLILHFCSLAIINYSLMATMIENPFSILYFNLPCLLYAILYLIIVFALSSAWPLVKLARKKPMKTIRGE